MGWGDNGGSCPACKNRLTASPDPESSTARARQYFLECFWAKLLGFTKEEGGLVPGSLQRAHLFPREVQQAFRSLFLGLHQAPCLCAASALLTSVHRSLARHHGQPFGKQQSPEEGNLYPRTVAPGQHQAQARCCQLPWAPALSEGPSPCPSFSQHKESSEMVQSIHFGEELQPAASGEPQGC